jgi:hypothetical protein
VLAKHYLYGAKCAIKEAAMPTPSNFSSVKLPSALVSQAKEAAQPLRRSTAGQIEYWATLGRIVEHSGLTAQEAQAAIENYEAAARKARPQASESLEALTQRVVAASTNGTLQAHIRRIVEENRQQAVQRTAA